MCLPLRRHREAIDSFIERENDMRFITKSNQRTVIRFGIFWEIRFKNVEM